MMLATLFVGVGTASAAGGYEALSVPSVDTDDVYALGTVVCTVKDGALSNGDSITLRLPTDYEFRRNAGTFDDVMTSADWSGNSDANNYVSIPSSYSGSVNIAAAGSFTAARLSDNEIQLTYHTGFDVGGADNYIILLHMGKIYIDAGASAGDVILTASGPSNTGFPKGSLVVGQVAGGQVSLSVTDKPTFSDSTSQTTDPITIRVQEDIKGDLTKANESLKFTLPNGLEWQAPTGFHRLWGGWGAAGASDPTWGTTDGGTHNTGTVANPVLVANDINVYADGDELVVEVNTETTEPVAFELTCGIDVTDEDKATKGDVKVRVSGSSDVNASEVVVGNYGEFGSSIAVSGDVPTITAGVFDQETADIVIKEDIKDSIIDGRTLNLKLPANAKWGKIDTGDSDSGLTVGNTTAPTFVSDDGREVKYTFSTTSGSTDAAELKLEDMEIVCEPGSEGDIVVEASGTAGLTGQLTIAKCTKSVSIVAATTPAIQIGASGAAGDLTITENIAGAIKDDDNAEILLDLPEGVRFDGTPKVEITSGDLDIDEDSVRRVASDGTDDNDVAIPVDSKSGVASTIKVSGIKLIADRTVPEGNIIVKVKGAAVAAVNNIAAIQDYYGTANVSSTTGYGTIKISGKDAFGLTNNSIFPKTSTAASCALAMVTTPASADVSANAVFTFGSATYKLNGVEKTMDVAPYAKDNRTYMPIRYVAYALGIDDSNILWDGANSTVTLMKGDKVVQLKLGSTALIVNGATVTMDVAPEAVSDRTMLPAALVAQAFGKTATWDATANTVTIK